MATINRAEIIAILGNVEDHVASEILRIGASPEELAEARNWVVNDEAPMNEGRPLASSRVGRVIALLEASRKTLRPVAPNETRRRFPAFWNA